MATIPVRQGVYGEGEKLAALVASAVSDALEPQMKQLRAALGVGPAVPPRTGSADGRGGGGGLSLRQGEKLEGGGMGMVALTAHGASRGQGQAPCGCGGEGLGGMAGEVITKLAAGGGAPVSGAVSEISEAKHRRRRRTRTSLSADQVAT